MKIKKDIDIQMIAVGICYMSVCVLKHATKKQIEEQANMNQPTGISSKWQLAEDSQFAEGTPNPCPCDKQPETRMHYLLNC